MPLTTHTAFILAYLTSACNNEGIQACCFKVINIYIPQLLIRIVTWRNAKQSRCGPDVGNTHLL